MKSNVAAYGELNLTRAAQPARTLVRLKEPVEAVKLEEAVIERRKDPWWRALWKWVRGGVRKTEQMIPTPQIPSPQHMIGSLENATARGVQKIGGMINPEVLQSPTETEVKGWVFQYDVKKKELSHAQFVTLLRDSMLYIANTSLYPVLFGLVMIFGLLGAVEIILVALSDTRDLGSALPPFNAMAYALIGSMVAAVLGFGRFIVLLVACAVAVIAYWAPIEIPKALQRLTYRVNNLFFFPTFIAVSLTHVLNEFFCSVLILLPCTCPRNSLVLCSAACRCWWLRQ